MTIFNKIINREVPAKIVYEDERCLAFRDINAQAPVHILLIPKKEIVSLATLDAADESILGHLMMRASAIAEKEGLAQTGFRIVINSGSDAGQTVPHLHLHILGGRALGWPPG
jgi:histidine triad (HIT) family protein